MESIVEGQFFPKSEKRVILDLSENVVGFAMYGEEQGSNRKKIFRYMIDKAHQRRGLGRSALTQIIEELFAPEKATEIYLCYHPTNEGARAFYKIFGFQEVGHLPCNKNPEGKIEARLLKQDWLGRMGQK